LPGLPTGVARTVVGAGRVDARPGVVGRVVPAGAPVPAGPVGGPVAVGVPVAGAVAVGDAEPPGGGPGWVRPPVGVPVADRVVVARPAGGAAVRCGCHQMSADTSGNRPASARPTVRRRAAKNCMAPTPP
jgi:hypothetical protein